MQTPTGCGKDQIRFLPIQLVWRLSEFAFLVRFTSVAALFILEETVMKKCPNCGYQNFDVNQECTICKSPLFTSFGSNFAPPTTSANEGLRKATKVFLLLEVILAWITFVCTVVWWITLLAVAPVPLVAIMSILYMVIALALALFRTRMASSYSNRICKNGYVGTGFKICTLLFVSTIAGILMFCDDK